MARALLAHHSFTLAYARKLSLFSSLLGVYQRQVPTVRGATLHDMSMFHRRYTTWASMMVYRMRAHGQWLNRSMEEVGRLYDRAFHSTSWAICHSYATMLCTQHQEAYGPAGDQRRQKFSPLVSSVQGTPPYAHVGPLGHCYPSLVGGGILAYFGVICIAYPNVLCGMSNALPVKSSSWETKLTPEDFFELDPSNLCP